jgi:hypothetical protein
VSLRKLTYLNIAHCSNQCDGSLLLSLTYCPLQHLVLDGLNVRPAQILPQLNPNQYFILIQSLSLRTCSKLNSDDINYLLRHLFNCSRIDLTECFNLESQLESDRIDKFHPFLVYQNTGSFMGFNISYEGRAKFARFKAILSYTRKVNAARTIQKLYRKVEENYVESEKLKLEKKIRFRDEMVLKIQRKYRLQKSRKKLFKVLAAVGVIKRTVKKFLNKLLLAKFVKMQKIHSNFYKKINFQKLKKFKIESLRILSTKISKLIEKSKSRLKKRIFNFMKIKYLTKLELMKENDLIIIWRKNTIKYIFRHWKTIIGFTPKKNLKLVIIFRNCIPLSHYNSTRELTFIDKCLRFYFLRRVTPCWRAFCEDYRLDRLY